MESRVSPGWESPESSRFLHSRINNACLGGSRECPGGQDSVSRVMPDHRIKDSEARCWVDRRRKKYGTLQRTQTQFHRPTSLDSDITIPPLPGNMAATFG
jgi:hypothetical protein